MRMSHGRSTVHARAAARRHGLMATLLLTVVLASPAAVLGPYRLDLPKPGAYKHTVMSMGPAASCTSRCSATTSAKRPLEGDGAGAAPAAEVAGATQAPAGPATLTRTGRSIAGWLVTALVLIAMGTSRSSPARAANGPSPKADGE